jgi:predicted O-linked N-acetylglucosamine transferase (SPINDLY family)
MSPLERAKRLVEQGTTHLRAGRLTEALAKFEQALTIVPNHPGVMSNCGVALERLGRLEQALAMYERVQAITPPHFGLLNNCAVVLRKLGRPAEALERLDRALALKPDYAEALANRGKLLEEHLNRPLESLASFDRSLQVRPDHADTWSHRGIALLKLDRLAEALASNSRALALEQDNLGALYNRAGILMKMGRFEEAAHDWERVLELAPERPYVRGRLLHARLQCCNWDDYTKLHADIEDEIARGGKADEPFHMLVHCASPALQLRAAEIVTADRHPAASTPLWNGERYDHERLRVAWLSGTFGDKVEARIMVDFFERHDRSRFEVFGVSTGYNDRSAMRSRMEAAFEHFIDVRPWSDEQIARWLRDQEIDILVIVGGFMIESRLGVLSHRPAPLQVNFAFPGSLGADYVDYMIVDRHMVPDGTTDLFREKAVRFTESLMSYYAPPEIGDERPSRASLGLPETGFVFCCFNNHYKIQPDTFDIWMRLLRDIEGSVLWLRQANSSAMANLRKEAVRRGVAAERIIFASYAPSYIEYIARFGVADLFVDAFPYNAHTTACEAMWAGLPLVTCAGNTAISRLTSGIVTSAGLSELVAHDLADYEARIRGLVAEPQRLGEMRQALVRARTAGRLFDPDRFCRNVETAFGVMHRRQQDGLQPELIDIK